MSGADKAHVIESTLAALKLPATVISAQHGPTFSRYGIRPAPHIRVSRILRVGADLALALGVESVRLEQDADAIACEVPRSDPQTVPLADVMASAEWPDSPVAFALGQDVAGRSHVADLAKMPHLLIAGATGTGKSVALNVLLTSMLQRSSPKRLRLLLIDAKRVELAPYAGIAHLWQPIVTEVDCAEYALSRLVALMERRYGLLARRGLRSAPASWPRIVCVVDELADLVMTSKPSAMHLIRLAQKARAAGIHLVLATQRPSSDVISGLLKANIPGRIALATVSGVDSRVILDVSGAEDLLGRGDMLYKPPWLLEPIRLQGAYVSDDEIAATVARWPKREKLPLSAEEPPPLYRSILDRLLRGP